jgi:RNA polymerase sigma-70 factor (ECF subfamily)
VCASAIDLSVDQVRQPAGRYLTAQLPTRTVARRRATTSQRDPGDDAASQESLDGESRLWWGQLHANGPVRDRAIAELYERLRHEAAFHIRRRVRHLPDFPRSDIDDLAAQAAGDALIVLLRKLDDYRGDSQFWTWARQFAALEAPVSIRRRLGHDRVGISRNPERALDVADPARSVHDHAEVRQLLQSVGELMVDVLTARQRTVLIAIAIDGASTQMLARDLHTTPGAIYKSLHDARVKLRLYLIAQSNDNTTQSGPHGHTTATLSLAERRAFL